MSAPHPDPASVPPPAAISAADVRKAAHLARLAIPEEAVERYRSDLAAILGYAGALRALDLAGVEPLSSPLDTFARPADDTPGPTLPTGTLLEMAPETMDAFVKVPKVLGEGAA